MHFSINPRLRKKLSRIAALTAAAMFAVPALASAATCPTQPTTSPFAHWGDTNSYFMVPGGNFESPLAGSGWLFNNADRTLGNEPFQVGGSSDSHSLTINGSGEAVSPEFCIDSTMQYFRFFAHALGNGSDLKVAVVVRTATGTIQLPIDRVTDVSAASTLAWAPTGQLNLASGLNIAPGQSVSGRLVFAVLGGGSWQIDDVYADPWRGD
jgi:hypothetical protein